MFEKVISGHLLVCLLSFFLHSDFPAPVEMNGKLAEDKSEDTDCDGSSLPEDFSEVRWQEAGRLFFLG